jgi:hypothetical protein
MWGEKCELEREPMKHAIAILLWATVLVTGADADNVGFIRSQDARFELNGNTFYFSSANRQPIPSLLSAASGGG